MTHRERQIFQWIVENPLISQEELAQKAGITRSSAAVHISNLMKKGYIVGKGYITNELSYITVIGAANVDIGGIPQEDLIAKDSNPGSVSISLGGVGRNIAHNIRLMENDVKFITALGGDLHAQKVIDNCQELGIDLKDSFISKDEVTSTYLYIAGKDGDMELAISDMNIYQKLSPEYLQTKMEIINRSQLVILDANIPQESIEFVAKRAKVPVFAETVSCKKAARFMNSLSLIHTITPNALEAEILSGVAIDKENEDSMRRAADVLLEKGIKRVYITLGEKGVYCADENQKILLPPVPSNMINATGAGDALMAGLAVAYTRNLSLCDSAMVGMAASSIAIEGRQTINERLNIQDVSRRSGINL